VGADAVGVETLCWLVVCSGDLNGSSGTPGSGTIGEDSWP